MNLRFRVLSQLYNVLPSAYNPAAAGVVVDKTNIAMSVYVNGDLFFTANAGTLTDLSIFAGVVDGIVCGFSFEDTDYCQLNLDLPTPHSSVTVRLVIDVANFYTYDNTFTVFGYDLGNNPNTAFPPFPPFPGNPNFDITLAPELFVPGGGDPVSSNIYPSPIFTTYRNPTNKDLHLVKLTSAPGDYIAYNGQIPLGTGSHIEITDAGGMLTNLTYVGLIFDMLTGSVYYDNLPVEDDPLAISEQTNAVPAPKADYPVLTYQIVTPGVCNSGCDCVEDASQVTIALANDPAPFVVNDSYVYGGYTNVNLFLTLIDRTTDEVVAPVITVPFTPDPNADDWLGSYSYNFPNDLPFDRDYILRIAMDSLVTKDYLLTPCSYKEFERTDCGTFIWTNKSTAAQLTVKSVAQDGTQTEVETHSVILGGTVTLELEDGVYIVEVERDDVVQYSYKVFVHCAILSCVGSFLNDIACADPCADKSDDCGCGGSGAKHPATNLKLYNFSAFSLGVLTYLQLVNSIYATNWIFTVLPEEEETQLKDLVLIHDRLTKYCLNCD